MPCARFLIIAAIAFGFCAPADASNHCPVSVEVVTSGAGSGLKIDGSACTADLPQFWSVVERRIPRPLPPKIKWLSVMRPMGPDHLAVLSSAWGSSCSRRTRQATAFLQAYRSVPASQIVAPSLAALRPSLDSIDNFYPLKASRDCMGIRSAACASVLLPPVFYYRVEAPDNSPKQLRGST